METTRHGYENFLRWRSDQLHRAGKSNPVTENDASIVLAGIEVNRACTLPAMLSGLTTAETILHFLMKKTNSSAFLRRTNLFSASVSSCFQKGPANKSSGL